MAGGGLPVPATPLVGRASAAAAAADLLLSPEVRLLTLTGTGGIGKTRLAIELAGRCAAAFRDGVRFVPLAAIDDPDDLPAALACSLRSRSAADRPVLEQLCAHLRRRHVLLALDNFEHLLPAAVTISALLAAAPQVKVLVTSRASLRVCGEHEFPVPPLPSPDGREQAALAACPAVELFVQRVRAADPGFQLTHDNAPLVADVCRRLEGIPLAIELAAQRARLLSPRELAQRLDRPLELLTDGAHDLPQRQVTLRRSIQWSHELLEPPARRLFARLGVFSGGCTIEAAERIGRTGGETDDVLGALGSLVEHSLVRRLPAGGAGARLSMYDAVRRYALERLAAAGEEDEVRRAHAQLQLDLAGQAERGLATPAAPGWLDRLHGEHDNLHAALEWLLETGDQTSALRLCLRLSRYWLLRRPPGEGRRWLTALALGGDDLAGRARALAVAAGLALRERDQPAAAKLFQQSLDLAGQAGSGRDVAIALAGLAGVERAQGAVHPATEEALRLVEDEADPTATAAVMELLGGACLEDGERAAVLARRGLRSARDLGDPLGIANIELALGRFAAARGDAGEAWPLLEDSLATFLRLGARRDAARCLSWLAHVALLRGDHQDAERIERETLAVAAELGDERPVRACLDGLVNAAAKARGSGPGTEPRAECDQRPVAAGRGGGPERPGMDVLSSRETGVLRLVARGLSNAEVAERLFISTRTVDAHLRSVYGKLGVRSRVEAARYAIENRIA